MLPGVSITLANGQLGGSIGTNDNRVGMVLTGAGTGTLALLTPIRVVSVADAISQGVTSAAEPEAYKFVTDFYSIPGTLGVALYLMLAANTTSMVDLCTITVANGIKKLINFAASQNDSIRVMGVARTPAVGYTPAAGKLIDSDVVAAATNAQAFVQAMFAAHNPLRILLAARVADITSNNIDSPKAMLCNGVGFCIGGTANDGKTSMGLFLGRVAATQPHVNIGKVADGALPISSFFIGSQPITPDPANANAAWYQGLDTLVDSGFMTIKKYPNKAGFFISGDPMAVAETDDYASLTNGRVIDKASIIAYQLYVTKINSDVDLDENNLISPVVLKALENETVASLNQNMAQSMSGNPVVYVDETQQITANSTFKERLRIRPKGYLKIINVELGFYSPTNS